VRVLVGCGEGTQRQLVRARLGQGRLRAIAIPRLRANELLGLPGLISTLGLQGRREPLWLLGPPALRSWLAEVLALTAGPPAFELRWTEEWRAPNASLHLRLGDGALSLRTQSRRGRFRRERALQLGVPPGPDIGRLLRGEDLVTPDERVVRAVDVLDPPLPPRLIVFGERGAGSDVHVLPEIGAGVVNPAPAPLAAHRGAPRMAMGAPITLLPVAAGYPATLARRWERRYPGLRIRRPLEPLLLGLESHEERSSDHEHSRPPDAPRGA
jgi:hypothetical protein